MENTLQIRIYRKMLPKKRKYTGHSLVLFPSFLLRFPSLLTNCVCKVHLLPQPCAKLLLRGKLEFKQTTATTKISQKEMLILIQCFKSFSLWSLRPETGSNIMAASMGQDKATYHMKSRCRINKKEQSRIKTQPSKTCPSNFLQVDLTLQLSIPLLNHNNPHE